MKGKKNLERAIVLGLILSTGVCGNAWAEGPITDDNWQGYENKLYNSEALIENNSETEAAIKLENADNVTIGITTNGKNDITLDSEGSGIRVQKNSNGGSITLTSGEDNIINFSGEGNGIDADSNLTITLNADKNNNIESVDADDNGGDGINIGKNQTAKISFTAGNSNIIKVSSDGIYIEAGSTADSEYIAENGNNEIESGNNGIDHRGSGDVILKAEKGQNIITSDGGDGIRVEGSGDVVLTAKENTITAGDNGIQSETQGTISIISTNGDNNINAATTAIEVSYGNVIVNSNNDVNLNTENFNGKVVGAGIHLDYGNNNGYGTNEKALYVDINAGGNFNIGSEATAATSGIHVDTFAGTVDVDVQKGVYMNVNSDNLIGATESGHININAKEDIVLNAESNRAGHAFNGQGYITNRNNQYVTHNSNLVGINGIKKSDVIIQTEGNIIFTGKDNSANNLMNIGIFATGTRKDVNFNRPVNNGDDENNRPYVDEDGYVKSDINNTLLKADKIDITIGNNYGTAVGVLAQQSNNVFVNLESITGVDFVVNSVNGNSVALDTADGNINIKASNGSNLIKAIAKNSGLGIGIQTEPDTYYQYTYSNRVNVIAETSNNVIATTTAISNNGSDSIVTIQANKGTNYLKANDSVAIDANDKSQTILTSLFGNNNIEAGEIYTAKESQLQYGTSYAVNALSGSSVDLAAGEQNYLLGAVYANGTGTNVDVKGTEGSTATNVVRSYTEIAGAGDIDTTSAVIDGEETNKFKDKRFVSAVYAEDGANIALTGENSIGTWADSKDANTLERTVWAYSSDDTIGSTINLTGAADIRTNNYELSPKSADVAVAAGTATGLTAEIVNDFGKDADDKRSVVNINYADSAAGGRSYIQGDILAAYAGEVNINPLAENSRAANNAGITITGNLLAGNNGVLIVDLGKGGILSGRADDYGDAGVVKNSGHGETFYDPAFSSDIYKGGDITLTMGDGSQWNVQGQSWITNLNTNGEVTIDLTNIAEEYKNYDSHALTIRNLNGNADIKMDLDGNRSQSDMLYIGQGNGEYNVELENLVTVDDMFADSGKGYKFSGLRFATVGMGSDVKFNVTAKDQGFNNVTYIVDTDVYNSNESAHENDAYNGESISNEKPGNSLVESMLDEAEKSKANEIMLLAADDEPVNDNETQHLNYKLVAMESSGLTDAGKTMLNMSRANYSNAIYMDRLNKRLGEARYINSEEDEGMWVRIRHDRIGKDDAYRSQNTMYELGYDQKQECDNGERRVGMAIDYMHGDTGYDQIAGKGEIDRYGLWLYDTWMGDKGHYADYVAKWGHLSNDFEIYNSRGEVTGDYSNNVFSVSAEYGRKKDIGNDWYFEPQVQAQLARVTGADYTTSQGTKVSVDGINSLIGRAGFRLGKDFGEEKQSTVYIKADVLHEFLGDQDIRAFDGTTSGWQAVSYENEGTWYDVGFGFAAMMSKSSYAFLDLERSFGHDNDETYQINVGMQWSF